LSSLASFLVFSALLVSGLDLWAEQRQTEPELNRKKQEPSKGLNPEMLSSCNWGYCNFKAGNQLHPPDTSPRTRTRALTWTIGTHERADKRSNCDQDHFAPVAAAFTSPKWHKLLAVASLPGFHVSQANLQNKIERKGKKRKLSLKCIEYW